MKLRYEVTLTPDEVKDAILSSLMANGTVPSGLKLKLVYLRIKGWDISSYDGSITAILDSKE